jgi:hypothetical protein
MNDTVKRVQRKECRPSEARWVPKAIAKRYRAVRD